MRVGEFIIGALIGLGAFALVGMLILAVGGEPPTTFPTPIVTQDPPAAFYMGVFMGCYRVTQDDTGCLEIRDEAIGLDIYGDTVGNVTIPSSTPLPKDETL